MVLGPLALGLAGLILGLRPSLIAGPVGLAVSAVTRADTAADLAIWHGLTPTLLLSVVTLAGAIGLYLCREVLWRGSWPQALRMERVYSGTLSALDALSRANLARLAECLAPLVRRHRAGHRPRSAGRGAGDRPRAADAAPVDPDQRSTRAWLPC